ncbi:MAG: LCP family protein [Micrococcales bacterium]|nr:LCP family protein [Micrococcales bacterium]
MSGTRWGMVRHGRLPRRGVGGSIAALIGIVLAVVLASTASVAAVAVWRLGGTISSRSVDIKTGSTVRPPALGPITQPVNILLVGSDSGGGNAAYGRRGETLNDVTILIHISPESRSATAISIPRDLWVPQAACTRSDGSRVGASGPRKFNEALYRGGLPCVAQVVAAFTGLPVDYAALIEFDGVVEMSNALGGVTVCLASPIKDPAAGLNLPAGDNTLQGSTALAFLRTRKGLAAGSDLARISNQQVFLSAMMRQVKSSTTLTDPVKLYNLATTAARRMTLSRELASPTTMVSIALALKDIPLDRISFIQYPNSPAMVGATSVTLPLPKLAAPLISAVRNDQAVVAGSAGQAQVDSTPAPPSPAASATAAPSGSPAPTASGPPGAVQLPTGVTGQSAADQTCSRGSRG